MRSNFWVCDGGCCPGFHHRLPVRVDDLASHRRTLMSSDCTDTPLHILMRLAATILTEANQVCGMPANAAWTAEQLRREADVVASCAVCTRCRGAL